MTTLFLHYAQFERPDPVTEQTFVTYKKRINTLLKLWPNRDVESITLSDVFAFKEDLLRKKRRFSYLRTYLILIRTIFKYAQENLKLPVFDLKLIKMPKREVNTVNFSTPSEIDTFLSGIKINTIYGVRLMAIVTTILDTGMRLGCEVLKLQKTDIDWEGKYANIMGKGRKLRRVYFRDFSLKWIQKYLSLRKDNHPSVFVIHCKQPYVPKPLKYSEVERYFRSVSKKTGIKITAHKLRRSFATNLKFRQTDTKDISLLLGHSKIETTERFYLGIDYNELQKVYKQHMSYGIEERFQPQNITWTKNTDWKSCIVCGTTEKEHAAKGLCHKCYMAQRRKNKLEKCWQVT